MAQVFSRAYIAAMAEAADWAVETETRLLDAALPHVRELGWTSRLVKRAARASWPGSGLNAKA